MRAAAVAVLAALLLAASASPASARGFDPIKPRVPYHSPQHFAIELKFGTYSPNIDATTTLGGNTPFADLFNSQLNDKMQPMANPNRPARKLITRRTRP